MGPKDLAQVLSNFKSSNTKNVVVGFNDSDDAAVVRLGEDRLLVQTVDFFTPIVDDPFQFGQIAAANSLSDIYAMGAKPTFALNIFAFPVGDIPNEVATLILKGGSDKAEEAGISILGGHSIDDKEPKYGLVVTGEVSESSLVKNSGAQPNDLLILTKPLGTGIISTAIKKDLVSKTIENEAVECMTTLNRYASQLMKQFEVHAATDVTGFGLLGHLAEMCKASGVSCEIEFNQTPFLNGVSDLAHQGIIPMGTERNYKFVSRFSDFSDQLSSAQQMMIADAQTSGGLLIALPPEQANDFIEQFNLKSNFDAKIIGKFISPNSNSLYIR
ncbi:MAG: selenide, water dikinase SelD [Candidatus Neomarinimicrobiota bacterium]|nr:selenide, water dikinase SelD [Candidatus Neomarinimicrobiota bacterium]